MGLKKKVYRHIISEQKMASNSWYSNNSSENENSQSSSNNGGFSNRGWIQTDSSRGFKSGDYQQHTFYQSVSSSSRVGTSGSSFSQPKRQKTEEEKRKDRNDNVRRCRDVKGTVKFLQNVEIEENEEVIRNQERVKSELRGEVRCLNNMLESIYLSNPTYMDEEFHRCRNETYRVTHKSKGKS